MESKLNTQRSYCVKTARKQVAILEQVIGKVTETVSRMAVGASNGSANGAAPNGAHVKGMSDGAASAENPRVGSDGKTPLLTTGGGHPVSDDNNRCADNVIF